MEKEKLKTLKENFFGKDEYLVWLVERFENAEEPFKKILKYLYEKNRTEAVKWLKKCGHELNVADWIEFFGVEEDFGNLCLGKSTDDDLNKT